MTLPIEKAKREPNFYWAVADSLLTDLGIKPEQFEFVVNLPLESCRERLKGLRKPRSRSFLKWLFGNLFFGGRAISVWTFPIADDVYEFKLLKEQPKHQDIAIQGTLMEISTYQCQVSGQMCNPHALIWILIYLGIAAVISIVLAPQLRELVWVVPVMSILGVGLNALFWKLDRDHVLRRMVKAMTLGGGAKPKRKRSL